MTTKSPYSELQVAEENNPQRRLHMKSEWQIVTEASSKCNMVD